jgi:hypothetical protein
MPLNTSALDAALDATWNATNAFFGLLRFATGDGRHLSDPRFDHFVVHPGCNGPLADSCPDLKLQLVFYRTGLSKAHEHLGAFFDAMHAVLVSMAPSCDLLDVFTDAHPGSEVKAEEFYISRWIAQDLPDVQRKIRRAAQMETGTLEAATVAMWWPQIRDVLNTLDPAPPRESLVTAVYERTAAKARLRSRAEGGQGSTPNTPPETPRSAPANPAVLLTSWHEIIETLKLTHHESSHQKIRAMNTTYNGPILFGAKGKQPEVDGMMLLAWWEQVQKVFQERSQRQIDQDATVSSSHAFGRDGTAVPEIGGAIKKRRRST